MISKELLSEVFDREVNDAIEINETTIGYYFYDEPIVRSPFWQIPYHEINIYELAHKCKEWALENNFLIESSLRCTSFKKLGNETQKYSDADTEPEAIFKACQWILDEKSKSE